MTHPPDRHGPNPFAHNPFDPAPPPPHPAAPPPPVSGSGEANTLATLSVVFAFVFAPAGAILGHLGLSQIARTRQRGRDRALVGVTLSYVFITAAVVALVVWAALRDTGPAPSAAPATTTTTTSPATTTTTTTTTPPPPPPPTVAPTDLAGLLPSAQETGSLTGLAGVYADETDTELGGFPKTSTFDPPYCEATHSVGSPRVYDAAALTGFRLVAYSGNNYMHSAQSVAAYPDGPAARAALERVLADWRKCGGTTIIWHGTGGPADTKLDPPFDAGNGITAMVLYPVARGLGGPRASLSHAIAVKSNILVDAMVFSGENGADNTREPIALVNFTLGKIPG
jgi:eukaryotic-like serine/threonine-protein kinase